MSLDLPEHLTRALEELNAIPTHSDALLVDVRELELRAEVCVWSIANPDVRGQHIILAGSHYEGFQFMRDRLPRQDSPPPGGAFVIGQFNNHIEYMGRIFRAIHVGAASSARDREDLAIIDRGIQAIRRIIACEFGVDQAEVETGDAPRWVFRYRPNLADFASEDPTAWDPPQGEPPAVPVDLPEEFAERSRDLVARYPLGDPTEDEMSAFFRDLVALRNDIARTTGFVRGGLRLRGSDGGWDYHEIRRGDRIEILTRDLFAEIERLNRLGQAASQSEWEDITRQVAESVGLPISHVERERDRHGQSIFVRSLVPADDEIANGQTLRIPPERLVPVRDAIRQTDPERQRRALDNVIRDIARAHRLPPGRLVIEPNRPIRCVYREPEAGQALRIPIEWNIVLEQIRAIPSPTVRQNVIDGVQEYMARYYGLDRSDVEMVTSDSRIAFQRRRLEVQAPPTGGGPPGTGGVTPPQPPPAVPIIAQPQGLGRKGHLKQGPVVPLTGSKSGPKILAIAEPGSDDSLSTGAIVGIVIGSITGLILVILVIFCIRKRRNQSKKYLNAPSA